jgi:hypothetical protein
MNVVAVVRRHPTAAQAALALAAAVGLSWSNAGLALAALSLPESLPVSCASTVADASGPTQEFSVVGGLSPAQEFSTVADCSPAAAASPVAAASSAVADDAPADASADASGDDDCPDDHGDGRGHDGGEDRERT